MFKKSLALLTAALISSSAFAQTPPLCPSNIFVYDQFLFQAVEMSKKFNTRAGEFMCDKLTASNASIAVMGGYHSYGGDQFSINLIFALKDNKSGLVSLGGSFPKNFYAQEFMTDDQKRQKTAEMIDDALGQWSNGGNFQRAIGEFDRAKALSTAK